MGIGIFGGVFDPPHVGHVELARTALDRLDLDRLLVLVASHPGHKEVEADVQSRLRLAQAAFGDLPRTEVELDEHPFTIDSLRQRRPEDAIFLVGADEYAVFDTWKEPDEILKLVRLGVATRSGYDPTPANDDRIVHLEIDSPLVSSSDIRARVARGEPIDGLVPPAVAELIETQGLYR
jgi:nicotinate-nucleotide adenylyltransferase